MTKNNKVIRNMGWDIKKVSDLFNIETGTTPSTRTPAYWDNGTVNWITPTDLSHNEGKIYISTSERKVTKKALDENNLTLLPKKSLVLSTRAPVGYVAILENEAAFNQGCKGLVAKMEISPEFYYYYLISIRRVLENKSSGSTFKELAKDFLEKTEIPMPSLSEQKDIAAILLSIDARAECAKKQLEKIERIKRSFVNEFFLKGNQ